MDYKEKVIALLNSKELSKEQKKKLEGVFPELKESEDEKIRKNLLGYIKGVNEREVCKETLNEWIAWLEKQGEQKPTDKVEPKFKVGQTIIYKGNKNIAPTKMTISDIAKGQYWDDNCCIVPISDQDNWELVEQKPAEWSEEDKYLCTQIEGVLQECWIKSLVHFGLYKKMRNFIKSLKDRVLPQTTWKPSDEQMKALEKECIAHSNYELCRLLEQLKKLREK